MQAVITRDAPAEELEVPSCPLCGSDAAEVLFVACDRLFALPGEYPVVRCSGCTMVYVRPRPALAALGRHYPDDYFAQRPPELAPPLLRPIASAASRGQTEERLERIERVIGRLAAGTELVDVGCGLNDFVACAGRLRGTSGIGVDFKPEVVRYVCEQRGTPIVAGTLHDARFASGRFDLVTMHEYLEHEPHPLRTLQEARRITRPGGRLVIEVPHFAGGTARFFGSRWGMLDVPRHLVFFTPETIADALGRCGFRLVHQEAFGMPFSIGASLVLALGYRRLGRMTTLETLLVGVLGLPLLPFTALLHEFMFVVAEAE